MPDEMIEKYKREEFMGMALAIYGYMNEKDDDFLEENNFSREEIMFGVNSLLKESGIDLGRIQKIMQEENE